MRRRGIEGFAAHAALALRPGLHYFRFLPPLTRWLRDLRSCFLRALCLSLARRRAVVFFLWAMVAVSYLRPLELSTGWSGCVPHESSPAAPAAVPSGCRGRHAGSARSDFPGGIDDRVAELREEAPVVQVPPRVEVAPMVGGNRAPSTPQHPAAPEDKADEAPPRADVLRRAGAGEDTV